MNTIRYLAATALLTLTGAAAVADDFPGWQTMRVIRQEGWPYQARPADLNADGRDELIVVNIRQSRLEIYQWLEPAQRDAGPRRDPDRPNELPMAVEFDRLEVPLERLPRDVIARNLDDDPQLELIVLETPPNRVVVYDHDGERWHRTSEWDLLAGNLMGRDRLMLVSPVPGDAVDLLISFEDGIQQLKLTEQGRAKWMQPREKQGRLDWWTADLDRDGDRDLIQWSRAGDQSIRWYENTGEALLPARGVTDVKADDAAMLLGPGGEAQVLLLGGLQRGILRQYQLNVDEPSPFGRHQPLPLGGQRVAWTGVTVDGRPALATIEGDEPRLTLFHLTEAGWAVGQTYPVVAGVRNIVAPPAAPGTLLLWAKDAGDLHVSRFDSGRFTFPRPFTDHLADKQEKRQILALGSVGSTVWWAQYIDEKHLDLFVWPADQPAPTRTRFADLGGKLDKINWLGGRRLLAMEKYARSPKLIEKIDDKVVESEPSHLAKAKLDDFTLVAWRNQLRLARIGDGVLQWLDDDLQPLDQVMLPDGQRLVGFVEHLIDDQHGALVLEVGGRKLHFMTADDAGVMRVDDTFEAPGGSMLYRDPVIGLVLADGATMTRVAPGEPRTLELVDSIDSRVGRPSGVREATIHRIATTDVDGDGADELIISDDKRHQLTALRRTDDGLKPMISWPVYEDSAYPYGQSEEETVTEPRTVVGLDLDGDGRQDLAMLCHDRLLIYLGQADVKEAQ